MKFQVSKLLKYIYFFLILASYNFFYLFNSSTTVKFLLRIDNFSFILCLFGILSFLYLFLKKKQLFSHYLRWYRKYYRILIIVYFIHVVYTCITYPQQGLFYTLRMGSPFLILFMVPVILNIFVNDGGPRKTLDFINNVCFIWNVLIIAQSLIYSTSGRFILGFASYYDYSLLEIRTYGLRLSMGAFGAFMILYNLSVIFGNSEKKIKRKYLYILKLIVGIFSLLYVVQTRSLLLYVGISFILQILFSGKSSKMKAGITFFTLIIMAALWISFSSSVTMYFSNMDLSGKSSTNRLYAITYYWNTFVNKPLFGNGFLDSSAVKELYYIEHGNLGTAYYSDVGIVGLLAKTGLMSLLYYFIPVINLVYIFFRKKSYLKNSTSGFLISTISYIILTSSTLLILDWQRVFLFPLIVALFVYYTNEANINKS